MAGNARPAVDVVLERRRLLAAVCCSLSDRQAVCKASESSRMKIGLCPECKTHTDDYC